MIKKNIELVGEIVKKNPIIWLLPLLIIGLSFNLNYNLIPLLQNLLANTSNPLGFSKLMLSAITTVLVIIGVLLVVVGIVDKIFTKSHEPWRLTLKKHFPKILVSVAFLFPLNIIVGMLIGLFRNNTTLLYFWNFLLLNIKNTFFFYAMYIMINHVSNKEKPLPFQLKKSFSKQIVLELVLITIFLSIIETPLFYFPKTEFFQRAPLWVRNLRILFSALLDTFFILYTAVVYYGHNKETEV